MSTTLRIRPRSSLFKPRPEAVVEETPEIAVTVAEEEKEKERTPTWKKERPVYLPPPDVFALKPVAWLDPVERLLSDIPEYVAPTTTPLSASELVRPVWWSKNPVFIRPHTAPLGEEDLLRYEAETDLWQDALFSEDETTFRMCGELSDVEDRMYRTLEQLRDFVVVYFGATYPFLQEKPKVVFQRTLRFQYGDYYSNHYLYGLTQWTVWWAWRVWQQSVYTLSRLCVNQTFDWTVDEMDARILSDTYDLPSCIQQLHQSVCLLLNLQTHFLPRWQNGAWDEVAPHEAHAKFDPLFVKTLSRANAALCQLLMLIDSEDYALRWSIPEAERAITTTIRPYHEIFQHLHALENDIDARLMYLTQVGALALHLHYRALTRYAQAYTDFGMGVWAWRYVAMPGQQIPQLANDLHSMEDRRTCYTAFIDLSIPPFELPPDWQVRLQTPPIRTTKDAPLGLVKFSVIPVSKFPLCTFRVK